MYQISTGIKDDTAGLFQSADGRRIHIGYHRQAWVTLQVDEDKPGYAFLSFRCGDRVEAAGLMALPCQGIVNRLQNAGLPEPVLQLSAYFLARAKSSEAHRFVPASKTAEMLRFGMYGTFGLGGVAAFTAGVMFGMHGLAVFGLLAALVSTGLCLRFKTEKGTGSRAGSFRHLVASGSREIKNWPDIVTQPVDI